MPRGVRLILLVVLGLCGCQSSPLQPVVSPVSDGGPATRRVLLGGLPPSQEPRAHLRSGYVTRDAPTPPPGFGAYIYVLPEREVSRAMLDQLWKFHNCLASPGHTDRRRSVALMLLPIKRDPTGDRIDVEFAHDLLRFIPIQLRKNNEVYFVGVNRPLRVNVPADDPTVISLGRVAPDFVVSWLISFQDNIERGAIIQPSDLRPAILSAASIIMSIGGLVGIPVAHAMPHACG
jgi:hypothetical protein